LPEDVFKNFLIGKVNAKGYQSTSLCVCSPDVFSIGRAYAAMGFSQSYWMTDFYKTYPQAKQTAIGNDSLMFDFAAAKINPRIKQFMFMVTMSMHSPYIELNEINHFGRDSEYERYLSTAFFVDQALQKFYDSLPDGALLCIWGDHPSGRDFVKNLPGGRSVPFIMNIKGANLAPAPDGRQLDSLYQVGIYLAQLFS
jgi:phosphoglycerol transferase MdoB-like AlkP superfamily enzyme